MLFCKIMHYQNYMFWTFPILEQPLPVLEIVAAGLLQIGGTYSLHCNVTTDEDVLSGLSVDWFSNGSTVMNTTTRTISLQTGTFFMTTTMIFEPIVMEDKGNYTCISTLTIPGTLQLPLTVNDTTSVGTFGMLHKFYKLISSCIPLVSKHNSSINIVRGISNI